MNAVLTNQRAQLIPVSAKNYHQVREVASEPGLIAYSPGVLHTPDGFDQYFERALQEAARESSIPYLIYDREREAFAGSTRFMRIDRPNRVLEVGATWIGKPFWGTGLNGAVKQLMLNQAFGNMGFERVEFRIDERNIRSRRAVEKLGARLEGILRENVYLGDFKRNTCVYGLLKQEWEAKAATG